MIVMIQDDNKIINHLNNHKNQRSIESQKSRVLIYQARLPYEFKKSIYPFIKLTPPISGGCGIPMS